MLPVSAIPSHRIATWLLGHIDDLLDALGLSRDQRLEEFVYVAIIIAASFALGWLVRRIILFASKKMVVLRHNDFGRELIEQRTLTKCSHFITPLVFLALIPFAFVEGDHLLRIMTIVAVVYLIIALGFGINAVLTFVWSRYNNHDNTKNLPLRGILNIGKGVVWIIVTIISASVIVDKSPVALLTGLGAFAAALMLIFKDSILGFVAGMQLAQNDMLRVGDWIVVPNTAANGNVIDVSLSVVKIRNWDMTVVMLPPYTLVSTSFQNYRGMFDMGVRRINESFEIEKESVVPCTDQMLADLSARFPEVKTFVDRMKSDGATMAANAGVAPVNGTIETNLGLFRAYLCQHLLNDPDIAHDQTILIRVTDPNYNGYPLDVYCFAANTAWNAYEGIRSRVIEHVAVTAKAFGLEMASSASLDVQVADVKANS